MLQERQYKRVDSNLRVIWSDNAGHHLTYLKNLSIGGCFVLYLSSVDIGERVALRLKISPQDWVVARGTIVHCQPSKGFGLRFDELPDQANSLINRIVAFSPN